MKKTVVIRFLVVLVFVIVLSTVCGAANKITLPSFKVTFNGISVDSTSRQYPLIVYKDITYFPMTYFDSRFLGLVTEWDNETSTLGIGKEDTVVAYREYEGTANKKSDSAEICTFNIVVNGKKIDNKSEEYPLLVYRDVTYFPLTWRFAVEEFGWDYSFSFEDGLVITSDNKTLTKFTLPDMRTYSPAVGTDGKYWYYTGNNNKIYRLLRYDWAGYRSEPEVIHTLQYTYYPDTTLVEFSYWNGYVFMRYHVGGASTGTTYRYKINEDGSCERSSEGTYYFGMVGANGYTIDADGFTVERYNQGRVGTSVVYYKFDGSEEYNEIKRDGIRFGECRNEAMSLNSENGVILGTIPEGNIWHNDPQVMGSLIYLTGYDENENTNSDLYVCDTKTGEVKKIIDNVGVFYVFSGWDNSANSMVDMVIFDRAGVRFRYSSYDGQIVEVDRDVSSMILANRIGNTGYLAVVGEKNGVRDVTWYDCYGIGNVKNKIYTTNTDTDFNVVNGNLYAYNYSLSNVKLALFYRMKDYFKTSENAQNVFITAHSVIFTVTDEQSYVFEIELD